MKARTQVVRAVGNGLLQQPDRFIDLAFFKPQVAQAGQGIGHVGVNLQGPPVGGLSVSGVAHLHGQRPEVAPGICLVGCHLGGARDQAACLVKLVIFMAGACQAHQRFGVVRAQRQ